MQIVATKNERKRRQKQCDQMLEYRVAQLVTNGAQRVATAKFTKKVMFSKVNHNITKNLGYFYNKINDPKLLKIAQSGHTELKQEIRKKMLWICVQKIFEDGKQKLAHKTSRRRISLTNIFDFQKGC